MFKCWCYVPAGDAVGSPGGAVGRLGVRDDLCAGGCHWGPVKIEVAVELAPGG